MKLLLISIIFAACAVLLVNAWSSEDKAFFREWMKKHDKRYRNHGEEKDAMDNVMYHKKTVEAHNKLYEEGKVSYERGLNEHSDLSVQEFKRNLGGIIFPRGDRSKQGSSEDRSKRGDVKFTFATPGGFGSTAPIPEYKKGPDAIDWRDYGLVSPARNQGPFCGSCWAFATAALIEGAMRKRNKSKKFYLSPQQLVDCSHHGTDGCKGGWPSYALDYVRKNGITSEDEYPYAFFERQSCDYNKSQQVATIEDVFNVPTNGDEEYQKNVVGEVGPVAVNICMEESFHHYKTGIYSAENCCVNSTDAHAPIIIGYGTDKKFGDYWLIKNSWGDSWGENGFGKFRRGNNTCDIGYYAVYAT